VADLTDPRVAFELELQARAEALADAGPRTYAEQAQELYNYHATLLELMKAEEGSGGDQYEEHRDLGELRRQ
jgi:hypothetical protein